MGGFMSIKVMAISAAVTTVILVAVWAIDEFFL
jgi:hypothetical protein